MYKKQNNKSQLVLKVDNIYEQISNENIKGYGTKVDQYGPTLLANLYSDKTHFIYELIQNAEDACARSRKRGDDREYYVSFELFGDRLEFRHNGIEFNDDDVRGICSIAAGTKKEDIEQIGKFGIGFKSVYVYTRSPKIYSSDRAFGIKDYVRPFRIDKRFDIKNEETLFVINFDNENIQPSQANAEIQEKLKNLPLRTLLFLNNINTIKCKVDKLDYKYVKNLKYAKNLKDETQRIELSFFENEIQKNKENWLVFSQKLPEVSGRLSIEVAYLLNESDDQRIRSIKGADNTALTVTFQTQKETNLKFLIQGPYKTTPSRDNIYVNDWNKKLIAETALLVSNTIPTIKEMGLCNIDFLKILPIQKESFTKDNFFKPIYDTVLDKFHSKEDLLPSLDKEYVSSMNAAISRTEELRKLVTSKQLETLFGAKHNKWLNGDITIDKTPELRSYLMQELSIPEITPEKFVQAASSAEFLEKQDDEWIIRFYEFLSEQKALIESLKNKPIIRLENNQQVAAYNSECKPEVYLPTDADSNYPTVKKNIANNKSALEFLKMLGLERPGIFAEISEVILPKYKQQNTKEEYYFKNFTKILNCFETIQADKKSKLLEQLRSVYFIDSVSADGKQILCKPDQVYQNTSDLKAYFGNSKEKYFVSEELYKYIDKEKLTSLLLALGIPDVPRRLEQNGTLSEEKKIQLREAQKSTADKEEIDYEYDGLENLINNIDKDKSHLLWKLLLKNIENKTESNAKSFFKGKYKWLHWSEHTVEFDSRFVKLLRSKAWLVDKNGNMKRPNEITINDLSKDYTKVANNIGIFAEAIGLLNLDDDVLKRLPADFREKLEITKEYSNEELKEILDKNKSSIHQNETEDSKDATWKPDYKPNEVNPTIETVNPEKIVIPNLKGQVPIKSLNEQTYQNNRRVSDDTNISREISSADKNAIGDWGEDLVYSRLKEQYGEFGDITETEFGFKTGNGIEVICLNKGGNRGEGCDFTIKKDDIETEYIEVKSTTTDASELMEITGLQWEFARRLYDDGEGNKYYIYVVRNVGEANAKISKIQNPIELWKEGKLYAQPVRFKLPPDNK